jgi:hypothetical protein
MSIQANHTHYYKVERIEKREANHHPDANEFRADAPGYNQGSEEACNTSWMLEDIMWYLVMLMGEVILDGNGRWERWMWTDLITKNHTDSGYGKKIIFARASGVLGKLRIMKLRTRQVYYDQLVLI